VERRFVTLVAIAAVLVVFLLPALRLPPSALQGQKRAQLAFLLLATAGMAVLAQFQLRLFSLMTIDSPAGPDKRCEPGFMPFELRC